MLSKISISRHVPRHEKRLIYVIKTCCTAHSHISRQRQRKGTYYTYVHNPAINTCGIRFFQCDLFKSTTRKQSEYECTLLHISTFSHFSGCAGWCTSKHTICNKCRWHFKFNTIFRSALLSQQIFSSPALSNESHTSTIHIVQASHTFWNMI